MLALLLVLLQLIVLIGLWRLLWKIESTRDKQEWRQENTGEKDGGMTEARQNLAGSDLVGQARQNLAGSDLVGQARATARQMLEEAYLKAQAIVTEGKDFRAQALKSLSDKLEAAAREELTQFREAMREAEAESVNSIQNVTKSIESKVSEELLAFHETMREETVKAHQEAEGVLKRELARATAEAEKYKGELLLKLDENVFRLVSTVVKKVMREGLSEKEHESLVLEALEEAKKKHLL